MERELYLSLCIPTNGIIEWAVPVIDSIYAQNINTDNFEVIITDNGSNFEFENKMIEYKNKHHNFIYKKTDAEMFLNQIEAFKLAKGKLIKFINHRMKLLPGSLEYLINFSKENMHEKPVIYFSNGALKLQTSKIRCRTFDEYVRTLSIYSSWSAGTAIWQDDFKQINLNKEFNRLFPHTDLIFFDKYNNGYLIDDKKLLVEIPADTKKKGTYNLFDAFCVKFPEILEDLKKNGKISKNTFNYVLKQNGCFISGLYFDYVIRRLPCSYNLDGYSNAVKVYYSDIGIRLGACIIGVKKVLRKLYSLIYGAKRCQAVRPAKGKQYGGVRHREKRINFLKKF